MLENEWKPGSEHFLRAAIGAAFIILGALAAIAAIPDNYSERGALNIPGYILAVSLLAPTASSWRNDARSFLRGENILLGGLVYWILLDILQGAYEVPVSRDAVVGEFILIAVAGLGFWLGASLWKPLGPRFLIREACKPFPPTTIFVLVVTAFCFGIWDFLYRAEFDFDTIYESMFAGRWASPWQRESLGDWSAFSYHMQYFGYLVPCLTVLLVLRAGWKTPKSFIAIAMSFTILAFHMQGGGRRIVGAMVLSGILCWLIHVRRANWFRLILVPVLLATLALILQAMLTFRGIGIGDEGSAVPDYDYMHVDDNFLRIAQALEFIPGSYPYVGSQYIVYALVRPVPRVFWPGKPTESGFNLADLMGIPDTSFALTMAGELYVSYGFLAVFLGSLIYGRLSTMVNKLFEFDPALINPVFPSLLLVWLFVGVRSMLEIMLMGYVLLAALALTNWVSFMKSLTRNTLDRVQRHT